MSFDRFVECVLAIQRRLQLLLDPKLHHNSEKKISYSMVTKLFDVVKAVSV